MATIDRTQIAKPSPIVEDEQGQLRARQGISREVVRGSSTALIYVTGGAYGASNRAWVVADTSRPAVENVLTSYTPIKRPIAAIMSLGNFPTSVETVHLQRVADLMLDFGQLKQRFDVAPMTSHAGG